MRQRAPWVLREPLARLGQWVRMEPTELTELTERLANRPWWGARLARQEQPSVRLEQPRAQLGQWGVPQRAPWVMWEPLARLAQWARLVPMETREQLANRPWWGARLARQEQPPVRLVQWGVPQRAPWVLREPLARLGQWVRMEPTELMELTERLANRP
jgi:hypothetical protein